MGHLILNLCMTGLSLAGSIIIIVLGYEDLMNNLHNKLIVMYYVILGLLTLISSIMFTRYLIKCCKRYCCSCREQKKYASISPRMV